MRRRNSNESPDFFWQGLLIVLPVILLAGLGLFSLRQDRRLAEQDARRRAQDALEQLTSGLGRRVASHLQNDLLGPAFISESGELLWPPRWEPAPTPAPWCDALSEVQSRAWQAAQTLACSQGSDFWSIAAAWDLFQLTDPPADAQVNADFALLRLQARTNAPASAAEQLWHFASQHRDVLTETGLPLPAVALGVALGAAQQTGLSEPLLELLRLQLAAPSVLTPRFLTDAEALANVTPAPVLQSVCALRESWEQQERLRELVGALQRQIPLRGIRNTDLWLRANSERWLVLIQPGPAQTNLGLVAPVPWSTNRLNLVKFIAKPGIERAFAEGLCDAGMRLPGYFTLGGALEGERLGLGLDGPAAAVSVRPAALLASSSGVISQPGAPVTNTTAAAGISGQGLASESMPSQPRFTLGVSLSDPDALYASQRQRSLWFGALILGAACTAVLGFVQARRALMREHQLNALKTNFVSSVSHELRAPIASVRLLAESLERGKVREPDRQLQYFKFIVQECRRLSSLIGNVLDFSRIEQGRKQYAFELTDLRALLLDTIKLMEPAAAEREVTLDLQLPTCLELPPDQGVNREPSEQSSAPPEVTAACQFCLDAGAVQQALVNLIDNALKHSPARTRITVGLSASEHLVRLWVQDQGPGIPASEHERIFERFYRLGSELRRDTQGVGIGLSIVRHIVQAHSGRVVVESDLGKGSRFILEIPDRSETSNRVCNR